MAKKDTGGSINLDSFLDILTCLQGILMLVIIATGIDAAQTKVLIPTPIERVSTLAPVYLECRNNKLFPLDSFDLAQRVRTELSRITQEFADNPLELIKRYQSLRVVDDYYEVDLSYYMMGQLVIRPRADAVRDGYELPDNTTFATKNYFVDFLNKFDKDNKRIVLIVRDDSFQVFKVAQRLAFLALVDLGVEIFDVREDLRFTSQGVLITTT